MDQNHRIVVVGGGFGGLGVVKGLRGGPAKVTLVDRRNFHLFQPLLYQVATGELSPANISSPLRAIFRRHRNCEVLLAEVVDFDVSARKVIFSDGELNYDSLVIAAGARDSYFGHDDWAEDAPPLKTIEDAIEIRKRLLFAFEAAERAESDAERDAWMTFAIVGAGPTGVELAGALAEIAHHTLKHDYRRINPKDAKILLIEAADRPLSMYSEKLTSFARETLERLGVTLLTKTMVVAIDADTITLEHEGLTRTVHCKSKVWAAGVRASPLGQAIARHTGAETDRAGRVIVGPDLSIPGYENIFVIGDLAHVKRPDGRQLPGLAPVAMQQGKYVATVLRQRLSHREPPGPFTYRDRGSMAVIGRYVAVASIRNWNLVGLTAWLIWIVIHLREIAQFRNRLLVFTQWCWTFLTRDRSARLITGETQKKQMDSGSSPTEGTR